MQQLSNSKPPAKCVALPAVVLACLALVACGDEGNNADSSAGSYALSATISGLDTAGLVLRISGSAFVLHSDGGAPASTSYRWYQPTALELPVAANSNTLPLLTALPAGSSYSITIAAQPVGESCAVASGSASGIMPAGKVSNVLITCSKQSYALGGSISGLTTGGLVLASGADILHVSAGASGFTMPSPVAYGSPYDLTIPTQPRGLTCSAADNSGSMPAGNVTNVIITCSPNTYTVGGTISGLNASGLVLLDNGGDATSISADASQFAMNTGTAYGAGYDVTVQNQPTGLVCTVTGGSGTVGADDVSSISIACVSNTKILYSFTSGADGAYPYGSLVQGGDGNYYGTTINGGAALAGTVFKITPSGVESVLYAFAGGSDGRQPYAGLTLGGDGNFYSTTASGGSSSDGTIYKITPSGVETVLHTLIGGGDGATPRTGLTLGSDGNFYGTTFSGGTGGAGTIFKVTPSGTKTVLKALGGSNGANPKGRLVLGNDGNFYGSAQYGGSSGHGTIFKITPSGTLTLLYTFTGGSDGANPYGALVLGSDGNFYGTTYFGGTNNKGTFFRITPSGTETVLYTFGTGTDGALPNGDLIQDSDGNFYGSTGLGGSAGDGTLYRMTPSGTETILYSFTGASGDGVTPYGALLPGSGSTLFGITYKGGTAGFGTVFELTLQ